MNIYNSPCNEMVETKIIEIIQEKAGVQGEEISLDAHLANDLGLDSLDAVELILELENIFAITIPDEAVEQIQTVRQAIEVVKTELNI